MRGLVRSQDLDRRTLSNARPEAIRRLAEFVHLPAFLELPGMAPRRIKPYCMCHCCRPKYIEQLARVLQ